MTQFKVTGGRSLVGEVTVPGDKSISHRALMVAALADGRSHLTGLSDGADVAGTTAALVALGARTEPGGDGPGHGLVVSGFGERPQASDGLLDLGNSGTTMRLLAGIVARFSIAVGLTGDASLQSRPMDRVATPLRLMGASVEGRGDRCLPPIVVRGGALHGIDYTPPMASAQVKSAVLLAGLGAEGETVVREPVPTRRHTEEMLAMAGAELSVDDSSGTHVVSVRRSKLSTIELAVPGDPSQAAFWVVAATVVPGSAVQLPLVYSGPGRRGFVDVLRRMGASIDEVRSTGGYPECADLTVSSAPLKATEVEAAEITGLDEVPVLAVAAAVAQGTTVFRAVGELRVKESDRFAAVQRLVEATGATVAADGDDLAVTGVGALRPFRLDAGGDHRMAMAAAVAGLAARGDDATVVDGWQAVDTSYPGFARALADLTGSAR